ncbi:hypothetical protein [Leucobacter chromiireducens]|uniref:DUF2637 domain-containing protein n=1 Tax=Leucobacter chromiireducens subsp. solipictus TaxID=398235 RepID=A0ABS1SDK3_9MICO|nr:hypothetical protein [Leucobacter chromiireducens]MBL3678560.1 hypothetical protein [Leucobacter chromiireducens subsp. solipictus]
MSAKKPPRTWTLVVSLGIPLAIVGISAMAISYATLIDVARVNGLPLPELFPVLVDVGTVATMIAAAQFRMRGVPGRWLAYSTFVLLSGVSIVANATHAWRAADLTLTSPWAAAVLASTPPAALLAITHLVMMLVPDEKERLKLQAQRERADAASAKLSAPAPVRQAPVKLVQETLPLPVVPLRAAVLAESRVETHEVTSPRAQHSATNEPAIDVDEDVVREMVLTHVREMAKRPTGKLVGEWLGNKTPKTGQRFLKKMEEDGAFEERSELVQSVL